jgi:hypothetical protein
MEDSYVYQEKDSNLRYLPGNDSRNDSKLERRAIDMAVVWSRRCNSCWSLEMMLVAGLEQARVQTTSVHLPYEVSWRMVCAGEWLALETGRRWRMVGAGEWLALETGWRSRLGGAGDWEALENGRHWRLGGAGDWEAPETGTGRRRRMIGAGEW